jgi:hypothetical protein
LLGKLEILIINNRDLNYKWDKLSNWEELNIWLVKSGKMGLLVRPKIKNMLGII